MHELCKKNAIYTVLLHLTKQAAFGYTVFYVSNIIT